MGRFIGVDLHNTMFVVCFLSQDGKKKDFKTYSIKMLKEFKKDLRKDDEIAVETTTNTRYFVKEISGKVKRIRVINPHQFKIISESVKKTDKKDAEVIAEFLSKDMIPEVRMKDEQFQKLESLAHTRDKLVKLKTALKNKIHNILRANGIQTKKELFSSEKNLDKVLIYNLSDIEMVELKVIVDQIKSLNRGIKELDDDMTRKGSELKGFENLTSIKGIGPKGASILLSIIGDVENFKSQKKLDAFFGIVPRVYQSNESTHYGRITKQGNKLGRTTLVQCTLIAIRYSDYLRHHYIKLKQKKGAGKAIIATARKLLGIIYLTLKNNWVFEDFPKFILKKA
jgi:transposase